MRDSIVTFQKVVHLRSLGALLRLGMHYPRSEIGAENYPTG